MDVTVEMLIRSSDSTAIGTTTDLKTLLRFLFFKKNLFNVFFTS